MSMGDVKCYALAKYFVARLQLLHDMQSRILGLHFLANPSRVYYKKLNDKTLEFIKTLPYIERIHSFDIEKGSGTLCKLIVNDLITELAYGTKSPVINLKDGQGWHIVNCVVINSWTDVLSL